MRVLFWHHFPVKDGHHAIFDGKSDRDAILQARHRARNGDLVLRHAYVRNKRRKIKRTKHAAQSTDPLLVDPALILRPLRFQRIDPARYRRQRGPKGAMRSTNAVIIPSAIEVSRLPIEVPGRVRFDRPGTRSMCRARMPRLTASREMRYAQPCSALSDTSSTHCSRTTIFPARRS
jgi:hypothetical protein